mmetsp:Transcript_82774/g.146199  ORF Transcript_82774/g.146199 Transcript_82774/m.146199 type:complete len:218 (-) Transcript_82774:326-979(-)
MECQHLAFWLSAKLASSLNLPDPQQLLCCRPQAPAPPRSPPPPPFVLSPRQKFAQVPGLQVQPPLDSSSQRLQHSDSPMPLPSNSRCGYHASWRTASCGSMAERRATPSFPAPERSVDLEHLLHLWVLHDFCFHRLPYRAGRSAMKRAAATVSQTQSRSWALAPMRTPNRCASAQEVRRRANPNVQRDSQKNPEAPRDETWRKQRLGAQAQSVRTRI